MTKARAFLLILVGTLLVSTLALLGLSAIHARGPAVSLSVILPLIIGAHLTSRVVTHYGASEHRRRR